MKNFFSHKTNTRTGYAPILMAALVAVFVVGNAQPAAAQSLGDIFCNVVNSLTPFIKVYSWIAYVAGIFFGITGTMMLAGHMENANKAPLPQAFARLGGGGALLALPSVMGMLVTSLFQNPGGNGLTTCGVWTSNGAGGNVGLDVMLTNFVSSIKDPFTFMMSIVSIVMGVFLIVRGLTKAAKYGTDPKASSIPSITVNLIIGAILVVIGQMLNVMLDTLFGTTGVASADAISWSTVNSVGGDHFKIAVKAALTFFQLVGVIAFIRGFNVIKNAVEGTGQATIAQGFTHVIGGVLAINIYYFLKIMDNTFGTNFL